MERLSGALLVVAVAITAVGCLGVVNGNHPSPSPFQITTRALPAAETGASYSATFAAVNGVTPYTWSIPSGEFPSGLELDAPSGQISGVPTQAGAFNFSVQVQDASGQAKSASFSINVSDSGPPQSLLAGCTVSAANTVQTCANSFPPAGWTLVRAQGFETGSTASDEALAQGTQIGTMNAHTGNYSAYGLINWDGAAVGWYAPDGFLGTSMSEVYVSYWDYEDPNARLNDEFMTMTVSYKPTDARYQEIIMDNFGFSNNATTGAFVAESQTTMPGGVENSDYGPTYTLPFGVWTQWEVRYKPNTPGNNDGEITVYQNGTPFWTTTGNFNGTVDMTGMHLEVGGTYGKGVWTDNGDHAKPLGTGNCTSGISYGLVVGWVGDFSSVHPGDCPPAPPIFHRYIDDIIVLKR